MLRTRRGGDLGTIMCFRECGRHAGKGRRFSKSQLGTRHAKNPSVHDWLQRHVACNPATPLPRSPPTRRPPSVSSPTTAHAACPPRTNRCDFPQRCDPPFPHESRDPLVVVPSPRVPNASSPLWTGLSHPAAASLLHRIGNFISTRDPPLISGCFIDFAFASFVRQRSLGPAALSRAGYLG
jgi:hypothetical protein